MLYPVISSGIVAYAFLLSNCVGLFIIFKLESFFIGFINLDPFFFLGKKLNFLGLSSSIILSINISTLAHASTIYLSSAPISISLSNISSALISVSIIFADIILSTLESYFPNKSVIIFFCVSESAFAKFARNSLALRIGFPRTLNCSVGTVII